MDRYLEVVRFWFFGSLVAIALVGFVSLTGPEPAEAGGQPHYWGDVQCDGDIDPVDALMILRWDAGLSVTQSSPCPTFGNNVIAEWPWPLYLTVEAFADVNCSGSINSTDALAIQRADAGLPYAEWCPPANPIGLLIGIAY